MDSARGAVSDLELSYPHATIDRMLELESSPARHHTKDKGDVGVACVIADLMKQGIEVALPISEHLPFDLLVISPDGEMARISVKFRTMTAVGTVSIRARSCWADRHGTHVRRHTTGEYDALAVYCPDTDRCYYVPAADLLIRQTTLRILETRNGQKLGVRMADHVTDPRRVFPQPP